MRKKLIYLALLLLTFRLNSQSTRVCLLETFCGENCPPCAYTAPSLNALLSSPTNTPKVVEVSWQVPYSMPTATWSLYQTNKIENDWRYKGTGGYGYNIQIIPQGRMDGLTPVVFGATSHHLAHMNNTVIATAQSYTTPFSIVLSRAWDVTCSSVNVTVNIAASSSFSATGNLILRLVMIERNVHFATPPGITQQKDFYNVAVKSFPTLQNGTTMAGSWIGGQTQTVVLNCPLPSYIRNKSEVAFVAFIQDDGDKKVWQTALAEKELLLNDAAAISGIVPKNVCANTFTPQIIVGNSGSNAITAMTITPVIDNNLQTPFVYTSSLAPGATATIALGSYLVTNGAHTFSYNISGVSGTDFNLTNNTKQFAAFYAVPSWGGLPVVESFAGTFPPPDWMVHSNVVPKWTKVLNTGGFQLSNECAKIPFFNLFKGEVHDLHLPPVDLQGAVTPSMTFDVAHATYVTNTKDTLKVLASNDCGITWTVVYTKSAANLETTGPQSMSFIPNSASQWRTETVPLPGFNTSGVLVKFSAISDEGNNLYIDNVNLAQHIFVDLAEDGQSMKTQIFPNPTNDLTSLTIENAESGSINIRIINTLGTVLYQDRQEVITGTNKVALAVNDLAAGIYHVTVESGKKLYVQKLCISE